MLNNDFIRSFKRIFNAFNHKTIWVAIVSINHIVRVGIIFCYLNSFIIVGNTNTQQERQERNCAAILSYFVNIFFEPFLSYVINFFVIQLTFFAIQNHIYKIGISIHDMLSLCFCCKAT